MFVTAAMAAETAEESGAFPPFDPTYFASQLLWFAITFGALYFLMARVIIPRLAGILETRHDRISRDLDEAQRLKAEADAAVAAYEHELSDARQNAQAIALTATNKAKADAEEARNKVEAELSEELADAEARINEMRDTAMADVSTIAADVTETLVQQLVNAKITKAEASRAVTQVTN